MATLTSRVGFESLRARFYSFKGPFAFSFTIHKTLISSGLNREAEFLPLMEATS
jgi:hypothetical protein